MLQNLASLYFPPVSSFSPFPFSLNRAHTFARGGGVGGLTEKYTSLKLVVVVHPFLRWKAYTGGGGGLMHDTESD